MTGEEVPLEGVAQERLVRCALVAGNLAFDESPLAAPAERVVGEVSGVLLFLREKVGDALQVPVAGRGTVRLGLPQARRDFLPGPDAGGFVT